MDVGAGGLRKSLEKILGKFGLKVADALRADFAGDDAVRASAEIDRRGGERFVHRHQEVSSAQDAALVADSFGNGFAKGDAGVFDSVVLIDVQIALRFDMQIERAVTRDEVEHVIEKANAGGDFGGAAPVEIQTQTDARLVGFAIDCGGASARHFVFGLNEI
jgi:hypothetical protein